MTDCLATLQLSSDSKTQPKDLYILCVLNILNNRGLKMPTITLSVPVELKGEMDKSKFINWSEVARVAIRERVVQLKILNSIAAKSKITEKDALEIGRKIKKSMWKKYQKSGW